VLLAAVLGLYMWGLHAGMTENRARAMGFIVLVVGNLVLALSDAAEASTGLFDRRHLTFWIVGFLAAAILTGALTIPVMSGIFRMAAPAPAAILASIFTAIAAGGWYALVRRMKPEWR
jgi:hypothetical protein